VANRGHFPAGWLWFSRQWVSQFLRFWGHYGLNFSQAHFCGVLLLCRFWGDRSGDLWWGDGVEAAQSCWSGCNLVPRRGLHFLFWWWRWHFELLKKLIKATSLKEIEGGGLLVGKFGEGLTKASRIVGGKVEELGQLVNVV